MKTSSTLWFISALLCCWQVKAVNLPEGVTTDDWQQIKEQIAASRYHPRSTEGGYVALNATQGWQVHFDQDGQTTLISKAVEIGMQLKAVGGQAITQDPQLQAQGDTLTYQHGSGIEEWWVNSPDKTEQWFRLHNRPDSEGALRVTIGLETTANVSQSGNQLLFTTADNKRIRYDRLQVWDSRGNTLPSRMLLADDQSSLTLVVDDNQAHYPITIDPSFSLEDYLKPAVTDQFDEFGFAIDVDGGTMVVGVPLEDSAATLINGDSSDNSANAAGAAYVFVNEFTGWQQQAYLKASNAEAGDRFGESVAISGNYIVVGAANEDGDASSTMANPNNLRLSAGAAYVFNRVGTTWTQQAYLKAHETGADEFAETVDIDGTTIVVGSKWEDGDLNSTVENTNNNAPNAGAVYVFIRQGFEWSQQAYLKAIHAEEDDYFGYSVAISGDTIVAGAFGEDGDFNSTINTPNNAASEAGAAYVFVREDGLWSQQAYLKAHNAQANDEFGVEVAIDDDTLVVGSIYEDGDANSTMVSSNNGATDAGAAYVYVREQGTWSQQGYLKAGNAEAGDEFASALAIAGNTIVVGAPNEDGDASSTLAAPNNNASNAGAAYVYVRVDDNWRYKNYLKANSSSLADYFGNALAISREYIYAAARGEDGDATSTLTSPNDNAIAAGAVYQLSGRYFVGGQVLGLPLGQSLELSLNGTEILSIDHNGSYEFLTDLPDNFDYSVSLVSVPTGYTCSITGASGTLGFEDITDVDVYCSTDVYHVTGTVTGLTGSGLVLRNNGTYDVIINSNGPFDFGPDFANGTPYDVEVLTQPNNGQICAVSNGSGTISGTDAQVSVDCVALEYTVGGTVSGLDGTLVLQNNGLDDLTLTGNGDFTFATPVTDGGAYLISVLTQPAQQTCEVSNASGAMAGADVTDVQVSCTDNSYLIGVSVSGLGAAGLVLQNNGADDLIITGNGGFAFATPVTHGGAYLVSVLTHPAQQTCEVSNASGTVAGANVTDVQVSCTDNSYFIGGSVTGLDGELVLQNNGADDLSISSNGGFVFAQPLLHGSPYQVTVAVLPNEQSCQVNQGAGFVDGDDVIDVDVQCETNTYLIGVSVSGLTGPGLMLQNNASDDLLINQNGVTPFATRWVSGSPYAVTVATQPDDPGNTCETIGPSKGVVSGGHVLVNVLCGNDLIYQQGFE
jgi:hypothetical protein